MTIDELKQLIYKHEDEFNKFDRVVDKKSKRQDIHAFLLLDEIVPGNRNIVDCAEHDQIWLDPRLETFAKTVTEDQMIELIRCGVWIDTSIESLSMYI